ncbi:MAG: hypothetical protein V1766_07940 [Pseudomonadota bacterium]
MEKKTGFKLLAPRQQQFINALDAARMAENGANRGDSLPAVENMKTNRKYTKEAGT